MITDLSYDQFCRKYIDFANKSADITISGYIDKYGEQDASIDLDLVKDISISKALEKAYMNYDPDNESKASLKTYLNKILRNQIYTEIGKEVTATGVKNTFSLDESYNEGGAAFSEDDSSLSGNYDYTCALTGAFNQEDDDEKKEHRNLLWSYIKRLSSADQIILQCWMMNPKTYADDALEELGWDKNQRGVVQKRKERAIDALIRMNDESASIEEPQNDYAKEEESSENEPRQIYAYSLKLAEMKPYVEIMKQYFGLNHPNLDMELLLLDDDPEREFELVAYVPYDEIRKALLDASFNMGDDIEEYTSLLWTVANLYYGDLYQRYEEAAMEEADDYLRWNCIRDDIIRMYRFLSGHKSEEQVTVKMGQESVELDNPFKWFQALFNNHLFPQCIPDITALEQANKALAKAKGRKMESKVATAIVNGVATFFKEEGLVTSRAPKNLCSFIRKLLIMMKLKDAGDKSFNDAVVKNWINNIQNQKEDPKIYTPEIREVSLEELATIPMNEKSDRWLFNPE